MILILGGARSGKSTLALDILRKRCKRPIFIATAPACDEEMNHRIRLHRRARPRSWITIEADKKLITSVKKVPARCDGMIIECIATYCSNMMMNGLNDSEIIKDMKAVLKYARSKKQLVVIVSNEVGDGVVPESAIGRRFRDLVGTLNQIIARASDEVYLITAGLSMKLK